MSESPPTRTSSEQTAAEIAESILAWDFSDQREKPPFVVQMTKVAQDYLEAEQRAERLRGALRLADTYESIEDYREFARAFLAGRLSAALPAGESATHSDTEQG